MCFWLSAFYYFIRKTVVLKVGAQVLGDAKRHSMLLYDTVKKTFNFSYFTSS